MSICVYQYLIIRLYQHSIHHLTPHQSTQTTFANLCLKYFLSIQDALGQSQRKVPFTDFFHPTGLQAEAHFREEDGHHGAPSARLLKVSERWIFWIFDRLNQQRHQLKTVEIMMEIIQMHVWFVDIPKKIVHLNVLHVFLLAKNELTSDISLTFSPSRDQKSGRPWRPYRRNSEA